MAASLSVRMFKGAEGERFAVLVDEQGVPLYYPNLYSTWALRARSLAANSILNTLGALKAVCMWESHSKICLKELFSRGEMLNEVQIRDLCDFLQRSLIQPAVSRKVVPIKRRYQMVGASEHYFRLTEAARYLKFLASRLSGAFRDDAAIQKMVAAIKASRPTKPQKSSSDQEPNGLDEKVVDSLKEALKPGAVDNPAKDYGVQLRNVLIFLILLLTGMRRGELLNLKISDIDFSANTISIIRRPDSKSDARTNQPTVKTLPRKIPVCEELMNQIRAYVMHHRNKVLGAKKHPYLFVTHKLGPFSGRPLSIPGFKKWMSMLGEIVEGSGFHAHGLRHHWNYIFSAQADENGMSPEKEKKIRAYLMGWTETGNTAETYNRRHTRKSANAAVLKMQNKLFGSDVTEPTDGQ